MICCDSRVPTHDYIGIESDELSFKTVSKLEMPEIFYKGNGGGGWQTGCIGLNVGKAPVSALTITFKHCRERHGVMD